MIYTKIFVSLLICIPQGAKLIPEYKYLGI